MHMQKVQSNAWLHFRQRITMCREIYENFISILQCTCKWCNTMHDFTLANEIISGREIYETSYQYFNSHANGAMQCMTSLLPRNPKEGSEGCNHIALSQCALLYR